MSVVILDYGSGNVHSAQKALERAAAGLDRSLSIVVTDDPEQVRAASHLVLPGVGAFADCKRGLIQRTGLIEAMEEAVLKKGRPFLGICVGMQLLASRGHEHQVTEGLGWIEGDVFELENHEHAFKVPHVGWNTLEAEQPHALLRGLALGEEGMNAYFVHSYHFVPRSRDAIIATCDYGGSFAAVVGRNNIVGTQFHPEKSQTFGTLFLKNFLQWAP